MQLDYSMPSGSPMTKWYCPKCGEDNYDFCDQYTHCAHCGRAVWVLGEGQGVIDQKWDIPMKFWVSSIVIANRNRSRFGPFSDYLEAEKWAKENRDDGLWTWEIETEYAK